MKQKTIFFLLSPYRARLYDFSSLILPSSAKLLVISDQATLATYLTNSDVQTHQVAMTPYKNLGFDFLCFDEIERLVQEFISRGEEIVLHTDEELILDPVAELNDRYGLSGMGIEQTLQFRDKYVMKQALGDNTLSFKVPAYWNDRTQIVDPRFPLICKPTNLAGAIGVEKVNDLVELDSYISRHSTAPYIIEQFIEGDLYHCDALLIEGSLRIFHAAKYFAPLEHASKFLSFMGSEIIAENALYHNLRRASQEVIQRFGAKQGMVHLEFIVNKEGIHFVEAGHRPAGAWGSQMYKIAFSHNIFNLHLYAKYGEPCLGEDTPPPYQFCCGIYLLRVNDVPVDTIHLPHTDCPTVVRFHEKNWKAQKSNSVMDSVAEIFFYSNSKEQYQQAVSDFVSQHQVIYQTQKN